MDGGGTTRRTTVDVRLELGDGFRISAAIWIAATRALRLREECVYLVGESRRALHGVTSRAYRVAHPNEVPVSTGLCRPDPLPAPCPRTCRTSSCAAPGWPPSP